MHDLIRALKIFSKYSKHDVISCDYDVMYVNINPDDVTNEDTEDLEVLGFLADWKDMHYYSFRFGSC